MPDCRSLSSWECCPGSTTMRWIYFAPQYHVKLLKKKMEIFMLRIALQI